MKPLDRDEKIVLLISSVILLVAALLLVYFCECVPALRQGVPLNVYSYYLSTKIGDINPSDFHYTLNFVERCQDVDANTVYVWERGLPEDSDDKQYFTPGGLRLCDAFWSIDLCPPASGLCDNIYENCPKLQSCVVALGNSTSP